MKKYLSIFIGITLMLVLAACGGNSDSPATSTNSNKGVTVIKVAHAAAETHPFHSATVKFAELVKEKTEGRIEFKIYPSRQLGDDREILEQTMNGSLDSAVISSAIFSGFTPTLDSFQLPFLINNYDLEAEVLKAPITRELLDSLDESLGLKGLTLFEGGMRHVANTKHPVESPKDLEGLKLRVVPSDLIKDTFATLNASPTPMAYGEVYTALQTNVIDGEEINLTSIVSEKHFEVLKHVTLTNQFPFPAALVFNKDVFAGISEEDQKAIQSAAIEATEFNIEKVKTLEEEAISIIKEKGITITELKEDKEFLDATQSIYEKYTAKDPLIKKFVEEVSKLK